MSLMHILLTGLLARLASPLASDPNYEGPSSVEEGRPFVLRCRLSIFATSQWTKDGQVVNFGNMTEVTNNMNENVMTLAVTAAILFQSGEYRCNRWSRAFHRIAVIPLRPEKLKPIEPEGTVVKMVEGETHRLHCEIDTHGIIPINWYKNEHLLSPRSDLTIDGVVLTIHKARPSDAGRYMCSLSSTLNTLERGWIIDVQYRAVVVPLSAEIHPLLDLNQTLECKTFGHPPPRISWLVGNVDVSDRFVQTNPRLVVFPAKRNSQRLFIRGVEFSDRNLYTCRAENVLGADETSTFLKIKESTIETNAQDYTGVLLMNIGRPLTLQCNTTEDPGWNVIWFKDDSRVLSEGRRRLFDHNNSLVIENAEEDDAGEYMCIAQARGLNKIVRASIFVKKRRLSIWVGSAENPEFAILMPRKNLTIRCQMEGNDRGVLWYKNGELVTGSDKNVQMENSSLRIFAADNFGFNTGEYMCVARARHFERITNATIFVRTLPAVSAFKKSETVWEGGELQLKCHIIAGIPPPTVYWYKDEVTLEEDEAVSIQTDEISGVSRAKLIINPVQLNHRAHYTCSADNGVGQANATTLLRVKNAWAPIWPLLGIVLQVIVLSVVIVVHECRKVKPEADDVDQTTSPKNSQNIKTKSS